MFKNEESSLLIPRCPRQFRRVVRVKFKANGFNFRGEERRGVYEAEEHSFPKSIRPPASKPQGDIDSVTYDSQTWGFSLNFQTLVFIKRSLWTILRGHHSPSHTLPAPRRHILARALGGILSTGSTPLNWRCAPRKHHLLADLQKRRGQRWTRHTFPESQSN